MAQRPNALSTYLFRHETLRNRLADVRAQSQLMEDIAGRLPPALRVHCVGARREADALIVFADSGVWATRLRYELPRIMPELPARNFRVRVVPPEISRPAPSPDSPELPGSAARALQETAEDVDDAELAGVLRRLASHHRPRET
jgi:hypothetical protein